MKNSPVTGEPCAVENLARVLTEEPRLEAVAYEAKGKKLAIATFGDDPGQRLAGRVQDALASPGTGSRCGQAGPDGVCAQCGAPVESRTGQSGHARVVVKHVMGNTLIEKQTCTTAIGFWRWKNLRWPKFVPREVELHVHGHDHDDHGHGHAHGPDEWKTLALQAGGCLLAGLAAFGVERAGLPWPLVLGLWLVSYVLGAWEAVEETWEKLSAGELDVHFLMLAVAIGAASIGAWHEGALLLFLFSSSGAMEHYAMGRTERELGALLRGAPKTATVLDETSGTEREVPVGELSPGQLVRVAPGQAVPADLRVTKGESAADESNLTGEARPVPKALGDDLLSGTLNLDGLLEGRVLRPAAQSALQKVISLIEHAQKLRAPSQRFTDKFGTPYTYGILGLCAAMFFVWWLGFHLPAFRSIGETKSAFYRAMTLLVVASPCALVLSIPSAILSAIAAGARRGVLFRGGAALEELARVDIVAMDKTGTLTAGDLRLAGVDAFHGTESQLLETAFSLARFSDHPLSRTIKRLGQTRSLSAVEPENFESVPGQGLRAVLGGQTFALGRRNFACTVAGETPAINDQASQNADPHESAEVWVAGPGLLGRLRFRDELRPESKGLLEQLRADGIRTVMLTGDRRAAAEPLARELGVEEVRAELLPEGKLAAVQELKADGQRRVAMIGDGVNDAPCLAAADVGVAMGARGSDAALEQAAVILMNDRLENFFLAYRLSCRTRRVIAQNLALSLGVVALMVLTSLTTAVPLALGVAAHEGSTVLVVLNSLRLLLGQRGPRAATSSR